MKNFLIDSILDLQDKFRAFEKELLMLLPRSILFYTFVHSALLSLSWVIRPLLLYTLGYSGFEFGLLGSIVLASSMAASLVGGWYVDRYNALSLMYISIALESLSILLLSSGDKILIVLSAVVSGLGWDLNWNTFTILISRISSEKKYEHVYSYVWSLSFIGNAVGAFMGWVPGILISYFHYPEREVYRITLIMVSLLVFSTLLLLRKVSEPKGHPIAKKEEDREKCCGWRELPWSIVGRFILVEALIGFGAALSIHNISYYFILKYGVGSGELGTMYGLNDLIMGLLMILLPEASRRVGGALRLYILLSGTSIPLLIAITLATNYYIAMALYLVRTVLMNITHPIYSAFMMRIIPSSYRGRSLSIINISRNFTSVFARGLGGYLLDIDLELPLRITSLVYSIDIILLTFLFKEHVFKKSVQ